MNFFERIKEVIQKLINKKNVADNLGCEIAVSDMMLEAIKLWSDLYSDKAPWLSKTVKSKNIATAVSREIARIVTLEMKSELTGNKRAEYLAPFYKKVIDDAPTFTEYACAKGGLMLKPYITGNKIITAYIQADSFYPTAFNGSGDIIGCVFVERFFRGGKYFTRLETHDYTPQKYRITNTAYVNDYADGLGRKTTLSAVTEWANLEEDVSLVNVSRPLYAYFKIPGANCIDNNSPLGISVFANAVNAIRSVDEQYSRLIWEFQGSELAVFADYTSLAKDGESDKIYMPKLSDRLYRGIDVSEDSKQMIEVFSPNIREVSLINGLDNFLRDVEFLSGLAYGTLSKMQDTAKTATEIKISKERSYSTVSAIQKSLETALTEYLEVLDILCDLYKLAPKDKVEQSFEWDDSLIVDSETNQKIWMLEVSSGLMSPAEYRMRRYGETLEQALENLPNAFENGGE